jgi:tetratricopeptide (TPR) repeat protein
VNLREAIKTGTYQKAEVIRLWAEALLQRYRPDPGPPRPLIPEPMLQITREALERQLGDHPWDLKAHLLLVALANASGDMDFLATAPRVGQHALALAPRFILTHFALAESLAQLGRSDEAVTTLQQAIVMDPQNVAARVNLINLLEALGRHEAAVRENDLLIESGLSLPPS